MKDILIVGGYGAVGKTISKILSREYPGKIIIAGRSHTKATAAAEELKERNLRTAVLDINNVQDFSFLNTTALVIMCIDQENSRFVEACIKMQVKYIDISANDQVLQKIEALNSNAISCQSTLILSVGLAPGISNLLVKHAANQLSAPIEAKINVLLGLGEKHGDNAYKWTFDNIHSNYSLKQNNQHIQVKSFTSPHKATLDKQRAFYLFNFSDQHALARTMDIPTIRTRLAFDINFITRLLAGLRKTGITTIFNNKKVQDLLLPLFSKAMFGTDKYGLNIEVTTTNNNHQCILTGNGEGLITAYVAAETARYALENVLPHGVKHLHEIIADIPDFLNRIKTYDNTIKIRLEQQ
ncbi:saccharopine dehydrogenase family protein [Polluticaenibacter yanchengensis]|uniref:Saccharopine dehydrogenase NADP-binding domain-containing protein n=1 Tax=Polluticaenibacter yanchengensis TaxID=3014562 RepID=A0ABT4UR53_9BACT|nr:saccharopine dehydrogenase NADP-binding domain-containing protein [Chitinophagaceae bacterium LY-5]